MRHATLSIETDASQARVVDFLAEPENLPLWAIHFVKSFALVDGRYVVETPQGERHHYWTSADADRGIADQLSTNENGDPMSLPMRVLPLGEKRSLVVTTLVLPDAVPQEQFERMVGSMKEELDELARLVA